MSDQSPLGACEEREAKLEARIAELEAALREIVLRTTAQGSSAVAEVARNALARR